MSDGTDKAALGYEHTLVSFLFPYCENKFFFSHYLFTIIKISDILYFLAVLSSFNQNSYAYFCV